MIETPYKERTTMTTHLSGPHAVTKAMLERVLEALQTHQPWAGYQLDWAYGQPRLEARNGATSVTERNTKRNTIEAMRAILTVLRMSDTCADCRRSRCADPDNGRCPKCARWAAGKRERGESPPCRQIHFLPNRNDVYE